MLEGAKVHYSKPMSTGDSTLMLLLSLNLLLLVFFMMLNSMATYGAKHAEDVLSQVRSGYSVQAPAGMQGTEDVPEGGFTPWRNDLIGRLEGLNINRIDLRVLPQQGNAAKVEIVLPIGSLFDGEGKLTRPDVVKNMMEAAGSESQLTWQFKGDWSEAEKRTRYAVALAGVAGHVQLTAGKTEELVVLIVPGTGTKSSMGLQVQGVGEDAGGGVKGVEELR